MTVAQRAAVAAALALLALAPAASAAPGDLDPSFGDGGAVHAAAGDDAWPTALTLSGARIVVAGSANEGGCWDVTLAAWLPDGRPDASLGGDGVSTARTGTCGAQDLHTARPLDLVAARDGRLFTGGLAAHWSDHADGALLTAHRPDGGLDPAFSGDGWLVTPFREGAVTALVRLPDGRLVAGGFNYGIGRSAWEVHRYLENGGPDDDFAGDGAATYPWIAGGPNEEISAMVADGGDGAVVAVGDSRREAGQEDPQGIVIGRILADGTLDPAFGDAGRTRVEPDGNPATAADVVRTDDGGFVVAGTARPGFAGSPWILLKFDAAGELDRTFGADGMVVGPGGHATDVAVDSQGRIVVAGTPGSHGIAVARYLVNGAADESFGAGGVAYVNPDSSMPGGLVVQPDDRILVTGATNRDGRPVISVFRLLAGDEQPAAPEDEEGTSSSEGEIVDAPGDEVPVVVGPVANRQSSGGGVTIRILRSRVSRRGVLVRITYPRGTEGTARARLWTRNKGVLLGQRRVVVLKGTTSRRFRIPLNRRAKRMLKGGGRLKVRATVRVTGLPARR